jgi:hypothetical protein
MWGFPDKDKLKCLIGKEITDICFGRHQISIKLNTDEHMIIWSIEKFYEDNRDFFHWSERQPPVFDNILSATIVDINLFTNRHATLSLDNGMEIHLKDDSEMYETIAFHFSNCEIIV